MEKQESIRNLKGIGEKTEKLFHILGIDTIQDLLDYYPREYEQYRNSGICLLWCGQEKRLQFWEKSRKVSA